ncbi:MAG TPA: hypothetical protein VLA37_11095 [Sphingomonadaceae bacterium]|nr:hypothetical protein [Sphingomonadaceae bacterium]
MPTEAIVVIIAFFVVVPAFVTLGMVLALKFWAERLGATNRKLLAAFLGPLATFGFVILAAMAEMGDELFPMAIGFGILVLLPIVVIGLPISWFATGKLDRMANTFHDQELSVFE